MQVTKVSKYFDSDNAQISDNLPLTMTDMTALGPSPILLLGVHFHLDSCMFSS